METLKHIKKTFTMQHDQSDCGVACLLSLIQYYGGTGTLENLRASSGTDKEGTTMLGLYEAAEQLGFDAEGCEADAGVLAGHGEPVILHTQLPSGLEHYIVCYGWDGESNFIIGDPGTGIRKCSMEELEKQWVSGRCLTLKPNEKFKTSKSFRKDKADWILKLVKADAGLLLSGMFLGIVIASFGLVMAFFSQRLIDDILPNQNQSKLIAGVLLVFILLQARAFLAFLRQTLLNKQSRDFNNRLIRDFYSHLLCLPKSFFDTRKTGDLTARQNDSQRIQRVISHLANTLLLDFLIVGISTVFIFFYNPVLGLSALSILPLFFFIITRFIKPVSTAQKEVMGAYSQTESNFIDTIQGIEAVKMYNKEAGFGEANQRVYGHFQDRIFELGRISIRLNLISGVLSTFFLVAMLAVGSYLVFREEILLGELMAVLSIISNMVSSVLNLALIFLPIQEAKIAFDRMFEFIAIEKETTDGGNGIESIDAVEVESLSFGFPGRGALFENLGFEVHKGQLLMISGESGTGKSTLANIIARFYDFKEGRILINGDKDLKSLNLNQWRRLVAVIPQDIKVFNKTLFENICLQNKESSLEEVVVFCRSYGFDRYFETLPNSYLTLLGENGVHLSGGQKQLLAFARALYHQPQLLILDEATSSMDKLMESFVIRLIHSIKDRMIIIWITHQGELAALADKEVHIRAVEEQFQAGA